MKSTLREFHEKYPEFEIFLVAASWYIVWCVVLGESKKKKCRRSTEAPPPAAYRMRININIKKKTTKDSLTTNVPPTISMTNFDDNRPAFHFDLILCVVTCRHIIEPLVVGSRRCVVTYVPP